MSRTALHALAFLAAIVVAIVALRAQATDGTAGRLHTRRSQGADPFPAIAIPLLL